MHVAEAGLDRALARSPKNPLDETGSEEQCHDAKGNRADAEQTAPILSSDVAKSGDVFVPSRLHAIIPQVSRGTAGFVAVSWNCIAAAATVRAVDMLADDQQSGAEL